MIIRKTFKAEIAHRLTSAYTKRCLGLHGHSYQFEIFVESKSPDESLMVMDFKMLKDRIYSFMDAFDHTLLISHKDSFLVENAQHLNSRYIIAPYNPTAEMMAVHIYRHIQNLGMNIKRVIVHETIGGCAIYEGDDDFSIDLEKVIFSKELGV